MGADGEVPWSEANAELVCKAQAVHRGRARLAFLMGQHRRQAPALCLDSSQKLQGRQESLIWVGMLLLSRKDMNL